MLRTVLHVKKNDVVKVITGSDKGKTGKVLRVINKTGKIVVEKVNVVKRHKRATGKEPGGIVEKESPIHASNVSLQTAAPSSSKQDRAPKEGAKKSRSSKKQSEAEK